MFFNVQLSKLSLKCYGRFYRISDLLKTDSKRLSAEFQGLLYAKADKNTTQRYVLIFEAAASVIVLPKSFVAPFPNFALTMRKPLAIPKETRPKIAFIPRSIPVKKI